MRGDEEKRNRERLRVAKGNGRAKSRVKSKSTELELVTVSSSFVISISSARRFLFPFSVMGPLISPFRHLSVQVYPNSESPANLSADTPKNMPTFFRWSVVATQVCADDRTAYQCIPASIG